MLRTGQDYLAALRDGRRVRIGAELVTDVAAHPAFRDTAASFAALYDRKRAPEHRDALSFVPEDAGADGEPCSAWYLLPRDRADLRRRAEAHRRIAQWSHGLLGRSMDHFASYVTGLRMCPELFEGNRAGFGDNLVRYHARMRREDLFTSYLVLSPQAARSAELYQRQAHGHPSLRIEREDDDGIVVSGVKNFGTGVVFADDAWIGNILPLDPAERAHALTCAVPLGSPGVSIWVREPFALKARGPAENYFSTHFDETDAVLVLERVKVPWERVFLLDDPALSRDIYFRTPAHLMGNHQSTLRFVEKLKLLGGIAHKAAELSGVLHLVPVQQVLGRLAAFEATLLALATAQVEECESLVPGYVNVNRRYLYAAINACAHEYAGIADRVKELLGANPFQMPADASLFEDPDLRATFEAHWGAPGADATTRFGFVKLAWDLLGSDFGGRHTQYERFYGGPVVVNDLYSFRHCPWEERRGAVDRLLDALPLPAARRAAE
ncbi:hypothetical protein M0638_03310 [Roseomonas sp. NAR14]|uniref:4-hydroxyphenylacetate 3-monooxygenase n=1 Tax=Roseomonas acroporae TaxID=2937791 RepID=A0A9X1Y5C7_9PROT|nr:4-hydroxyphenylacetate 3-hydroxylase N-terminal domain-containing protein [Roseomonas acroporae]MCK8783412.1 hypothetical protein [Roseomonas acroporae]